MSQIVVAPQWYGAYKKGPEVGALRLADLFEKEGLSEQALILVPDENPGEDHLMPFFNAIDKVDIQKTFFLLKTSCMSGQEVLILMR